MKMEDKWYIYLYSQTRLQIEEGDYCGGVVGRLGGSVNLHVKRCVFAELYHYYYHQYRLWMGTI